jgi:uncharacterized protein (TIGR01777 family)
MERVLLTGASGPIGTALLASLKAQGIQVARMVRGPAQSPDQVSWDPLHPVPPESVSGFDTVIHLAGESVAGRWTAVKKRAIRDSRALGTAHLASALALANPRPQVLVSASAVGFYGNRGDEILTEESASGEGFLANVSREWESATRAAADAGIRVVNVRIGLVLSPHDGAMEKMLTPFRFGLGGRIGSGQQWWSWIHLDDLVGAIHHAIHTNSLSGPVNLVAPNAVRNAEFTKILAAVLRRPAWFPVPAFAIRLALGEMGESLLLAGQHVEPAKLQASGYSFRFRELRQALEDLLR